jgi:hypothetical protein
MGQELKQRVEYLINDLKAYQDYDHGKKGLCHTVKYDLYMWKKQQKDMVVIQVPQLYKDLWKQSRRKTKDQQPLKTLEEDWKAFPTYSSDGNHLRIEDKHGQLLIYRLPISPQYTETLAATAHLIPPSPATEHRRGHTSEKYWGLWKKYKMEPHMTGEYKKDFPASQQWLDANQPYFKHMSNVLCLLDPRIYVRYTSVNQFLPEGLKPACGVWHACGIMRNIMGKGTPHKDPSDYHCGFNVSTAWGDYTTARMVFWELEITVEVQKEEAIFFLPRIITHNAVDIQGGVRNVVDAFVHENVLIWKDRQQERVIGEHRGGPKKKRRRLGLEELRVRNSGESSSREIGNAPESTQDKGDSGTEGKMEALYHKGVQEELGEEEDQN